MEEVDVLCAHGPFSILSAVLSRSCWDVCSGPSPGCSSATGLDARPAVPSFCQRCCLPQPQIKNGKGAARKSGSPRLSGLMSKMFQSSGNLLQSGIFSLLLQRASQRERNEREEKWYLVVGSDRSTFLSIDMRSERGAFFTRDAESAVVLKSDKYKCVF